VPNPIAPYAQGNGNYQQGCMQGDDYSTSHCGQTDGDSTCFFAQYYNKPNGISDCGSLP
jgi:hypothetical protein